jgi:hypothetical protein
MKKRIERRSRSVTLRLTQAEYDAVQNDRKMTTCKELSEYIRRCVFNKPVSIAYRNKSLDDFLLEMIVLRKELNAIGNVLSQSVNHLRTFTSAGDILNWALLNERDKQQLSKIIEQIHLNIEKFYQQQCSQE